AAGSLAVRNAGHTARERIEHGGSAGGGEFLQRFAAGKHEHHDGGDKIFTKRDRRQDGNASEKIGTELAAKEFFQKHPDQWYAADQKRGKERRIGGKGREVQGILEQDMQEYCNKGEPGDVGFFRRNKSRLRGELH